MSHLFQYRTFAAKIEEEEKAKGSSTPSDLFYMKQTISNACGTVAMLHAVGNNTVRKIAAINLLSA